MLVLLVLMLFQAFIEKKLYNPASLFFGIWFLICFLANLQLYDMYSFSYMPYFLVLIGCVSFFIGYCTLRFYKKNIHLSFGSENVSQNGVYIFRQRIVLICTFIVLIVFGIIAVRVLALMKVLGYSYSQIRTLFLHGGNSGTVNIIYGSKIINLLDLFIARPMFFALIPVSIVRFVSNKKLDAQIVIFLLDFVCYIFFTFSRFALVYLFVNLIFAFILSGQSINLQDKKKIKRLIRKYVLPLLIVVCVAIIYISVVRQSGKSNPLSIGEQFYSYLAVTLPLMDQWVSYVQDENIFTYGMFFFKGFINFFMTFFQKIGFEWNLFDLASDLNSSTETFIYVFPHQPYNAFVSMFFMFYADFRFLGVCLGSAIYGGIIGRSFRNVAKKMNAMNLSIFLLLMQSLVKCYVRWEFLQMSYCLAFIWLLIFIEKKYIPVQANGD